MRIQRTERPTRILLDLASGHCFEDDGEVYLMVDCREYPVCVTLNPSFRLAVNTRTGVLKVFRQDATKPVFIGYLQEESCA